MSYDLKLSKHSTIGEIRIGCTPTEIKINTTELNTRHQIFVRNLSSYYIWWCWNESDCEYGGKNTHIIRSGEGFTIDLDRNRPTQIWCITKCIGGAPLDIMEVV